MIWWKKFLALLGLNKFNKVKDVNVSTVSKAFKQCELKGLLTSTIGSGTFVSYDATTNSYIMPGKKDLEMIEMASIFPDMGANEEIVEKLKEISFEPDVGNLFTYAKPGGEIDLCGHATLACAYVVMNKIEPDLKTVTFSTMSGDWIVNRKGDLYEMDFPAYDLKPVEITDAMVDAIGAKPVEAYMGRDLLCVFDDEKTVNLLYSILFIVFKFLHFTNTYIKICNILQMNNFIT